MSRIALANWLIFYFNKFITTSITSTAAQNTRVTFHSFIEQKSSLLLDTTNSFMGIDF